MKTRLHELDGLRGWAAVIVLLTHVFGEMLVSVVPEVRWFGFRPLLAGSMAVSVFFVLSGYALSHAFFASGFKPAAIDKLVVRRYVRLTALIFFSCLMTFVLMKAGLIFSHDADRILRTDNWLGAFLNFEPSLIGFLKYSLIGVYESHSRDVAYNPFLWTMSVEMIGSFLVFLACYCWTRLKQPVSVVLAWAAILILLRSPLGLFLLGVVFAWWGTSGDSARLFSMRWAGPIAGLFLLLCLVLFVSLKETSIPRLLNMALSAGLVFCLVNLRTAVSLLSSGVSRFVGKISFPLYLVHFQVIVCLQSYLVVQRCARNACQETEYLAIAGVVCVVSIACAYVIALLEGRFLRMANAWLDGLLKPE
ncbi:MAG: acyltransferase [Rhodocyclaceae bacterium]